MTQASKLVKWKKFNFGPIIKSSVVHLRSGPWQNPGEIVTGFTPPPPPQLSHCLSVPLSSTNYLTVSTDFGRQLGAKVSTKLNNSVLVPLNLFNLNEKMPINLILKE